MLALQDGLIVKTGWRNKHRKRLERAA